MGWKGSEQRGRGARAGRGHFGDSPLTVAVIVRERPSGKGWIIVKLGVYPGGQGIVRL